MTSGEASIGFIGTGAIAADMVNGLCGVAGFQSPVFVSARNRDRSAALTERYGNVSVVEENQRIVDSCGTVFLSVLPEQAVDVLNSLQFRADQTLVSLVAARSVEQLKQLAAPVERVFRIIPLPPVAQGLGPIPLFPGDGKIEDFLKQIGTPVPVAEEAAFSKFSAASAVMATWFELTATVAKWMQSRGVDADSAATYSSSISHALATVAAGSNTDHLHALSEECLTAGGLNEQVLYELRELGWFQQLHDRLDRIAERLDG